MSASSILSRVARVVAIVLVGLVTGSIFCIWRGYDFAQYSPATLVEVWQGAVRGLNVLLPAQGFAAIVLVVGLAVAARRAPRLMAGYVVVALLLAAAALVTRFGNQPLNELVMHWSADALPADWEATRDAWRGWHLVRLACSMAAQIVLILTSLADRRA